MKVKISRCAARGHIPEPGQLFRVHDGKTVYIRVTIPSSEDRFIKYEIPEDCIFCVSLESGILHTIPIHTQNREGFVLLQPENGVLVVERVPAQCIPASAPVR